MRKTISVTPQVWERWAAAAAEDGARQGRPVPISEWIRVACREKIERVGGFSSGAIVCGPLEDKKGES